MIEKLMSRNTHVVRRGAVYYFRMRIPSDLIEHYGKKEVLFSLKTKDKAEANRLGCLEGLRFYDEFAVTRSRLTIPAATGMNPEDIRGLAHEFYYSLMEDDELQRRSGSITEGYELAIDTLESHAKPVLAGNWSYDNGDGYRWFANHVRQEADALNVHLTPNSELERNLIYAFAEAAVRAVEAIQERDKGKFIPTPKHELKGTLNNLNQPSKDTHTPLTTIIKEYSLEQENAGNWTGKTGPENRAIFKLLIEIIGDVDATEVGYGHARLFKTTVQRLPANINKNPAYRDKSISEVLAMSNVTPMSITTANKYLTRVSSLFEWSTRHGYIAQNYASKLLIPQKGQKASDKRKMFEPPHLEAIFKAIAERKTSNGKLYSFHYWAPLLGYFTAGRINEIASLRLSDFQTRDGIPFISIRQQNDEDKETKTGAGIRDIPLHSALIRLGLLDHVTSLKALGEIRLFPELKMTKNGYGGNITRWFSSGSNSKTESFLWRSAGIKDKKLAFHSYRHTMTTLLERSETRDVLVKRILGHTLEDDVTFGTYSKGPDLGQLLKAITEAIPESPLGDFPEFEMWLGDTLKP